MILTWCERGASVVPHKVLTALFSFQDPIKDDFEEGGAVYADDDDDDCFSDVAGATDGTNVGTPNFTRVKST